jgi:streptogramin lyase
MTNYLLIRNRSARRLACLISAMAVVLLSACVWNAAAYASVEHVCSEASGNKPTCYVLLDQTKEGVKTYTAGSGELGGFDPSDLRSAYKLPSTGGSGQTVAIVDAYNDPNAESDLAAYRSHYGLSECTKENKCFKKVNQKGEEGSYPTGSAGWSVEISLDLDMVSAACPGCHILLVEANNAENIGELAAAANEAAKLGATEISNSYGEPEEYESEGKGFAKYDSDYTHPGIPVTVSAGDEGYDNWEAGAKSPSFPATVPDVISVGGTTLLPTEEGSRGWAETVWGTEGFYSSSGGCSKTQSKPSWQDFYTACEHRMDNDVAAVADPSTPVSIYDTYGYSEKWHDVGGTSVASPFIAGVEGLSTSYSRSLEGADAFYLDASHMFDITKGTNFAKEEGCTPTSLCNAGTGYDGPSGNGTPDGALELKGAPVNTVLPVASPEPPDQAVPESTTNGTWTNEPTGYTYQWERCNATGGECKEISGATSSTYTPVEADVEHTLVVKVTAKNSEGSNSASSAATNKVKPIGAITEYSLPSGSGPRDITAGPLSTLWFTDEDTSEIGKITTSGTVTEYALPKGSAPHEIATGPDGNLWFTDKETNKIGKSTTSGTITEYSLPNESKPVGIVAGPDGNLWFADTGTSEIGKITTSGTITEYALPKGSGPREIVAGPDGNLWFTNEHTSKIGKITTSGTITEYALPEKSEPEGIAAGPAKEATLWFTDFGSSKVGKITMSGTVTEYSLPEKSEPWGIVAGPDGNLWFADFGSSKIGRVTTSGTITEYSLPSKSEPDGVAVGSDDNVWYANRESSKIGKITP